VQTKPISLTAVMLLVVAETLVALEKRLVVPEERREGDLRRLALQSESTEGRAEPTAILASARNRLRLGR
jgi:hypothetical protein